jgi:hypothetical protein
VEPNNICEAASRSADACRAVGVLQGCVWQGGGGGADGTAGAACRMRDCSGLATPQACNAAACLWDRLGDDGAASCADTLSDAEQRWARQEELRAAMERAARAASAAAADETAAAVAVPTAAEACAAHAGQQAACEAGGQAPKGQEEQQQRQQQQHAFAARRCQWMAAGSDGSVDDRGAAACVPFACEGIVGHRDCAAATNCAWQYGAGDSSNHGGDGGRCATMASRWLAPRPWQALGTYVPDGEAHGTADPPGWAAAAAAAATAQSDAQLRAQRFDLDLEQEVFCAGAGGGGDGNGNNGNGGGSGGGGGSRVAYALVAESVSRKVGMAVPQSALLLRAGDQLARLPQRQGYASFGGRPALLVADRPSRIARALPRLGARYAGHCPLLRSSDDLSAMLAGQGPREQLVVGFFDAAGLQHEEAAARLGAAAGVLEESAAELRAMAANVTAAGEAAWALDSSEGGGGGEGGFEEGGALALGSTGAAAAALAEVANVTAAFTAARAKADAAVIAFCKHRLAGAAFAAGGEADTGAAADLRSTTFAVAAPSVRLRGVAPGTLLLVRGASDRASSGATLGGRGAALVGDAALSANASVLPGLLERMLHGPRCDYLASAADALEVMGDNSRVVVVGFYEEGAPPPPPQGGEEAGSEATGAAGAAEAGSEAAEAALALAANRSAAFCDLSARFGVEVRFALATY